MTSVFRDVWAQTPPGELLSRERMLAEIHATVRMPEADRAAADALLVGLAQGRFVTTELVENVWHYRRSGKLPEEPKGPADNGPGSPGFNAVLLKAHEENQTRLTVRWPLTPRPISTSSASCW